jgi:chorismate dehydratase
VFAFWALRGAALQDADPAIDLSAVFRDSRDHGLVSENLEVISRNWAPRLALSETDVHSYLTENIHYQLDAGCIEGLQLFYRYAAELGVLPSAPELRFVQMLRAFAD